MYVQVCEHRCGCVFQGHRLLGRHIKGEKASVVNQGGVLDEGPLSHVISLEPGPLEPSANIDANLPCQILSCLRT